MPATKVYCPSSLKVLWAVLLLMLEAVIADPLEHDSCLLSRRFDLRRASRALTADECSADSMACPPCGKEATCMLWGDPHIYLFDGAASFRLLTTGDYWLVKSDCVQIQARYAEGDKQARGVISAIAIGGAFLEGHRLIVETRRGQITWDGAAIMDTLPSAFSVDGLVQASYSTNGQHIDAALTSFTLRSLEIALPLGIRVLINRWPDHLDALISMRPLPGGQDGHCGNFNGEADDDTEQLVTGRSAGSSISEEESLFSLPATTLPSMQTTLTLDDCAEDRKVEAIRLCREVENQATLSVDMDLFEDSCIFDVCFADISFASEDLAAEETMETRVSEAASGESCDCNPAGTTTPMPPAAQAASASTRASTTAASTTPEPTTTTTMRHTTMAPLTSESARATAVATTAAPTTTVTATAMTTTSAPTTTPPTTIPTTTSTTTSTMTTTSATTTITTTTITTTVTTTTTTPTTTTTSTSTTTSTTTTSTTPTTTTTTPPTTTTTTTTITTITTTTTVTTTSTTTTEAPTTTTTSTSTSTSTSTTTTTRTTSTTTTTPEMINCAVWGEPHLTTFDLYKIVGPDHEDNLVANHDGTGYWRIEDIVFPFFFLWGDFWLVYSENVRIQARYASRSGYAVHGVAMGGPFLGGHTLEIEDLFDGQGDAKWDGQAVIDTFFNEYVTMRLQRSGSFSIVSVLFQLPNDVTVSITRNGFATVKVTMPQQVNGQDGHCGKGDGDLTDDTTAHFVANKWEVSPADSFFSTPPPPAPNSLLEAGSVGRHSDHDSDGDVNMTHFRYCVESTPESALATCEGLFNTANFSSRPAAAAFIRACAIDVCVANNASVAGDALGVFKDVRSFKAMIRWPAFPDLCVEVGGGEALEGSGIQLWECDPNLKSMSWRLPEPGSVGQIVWDANPDFCMNVQLATSPPLVQIWECQDHPNMHFILEENGNGKIRWAQDQTKCLDVSHGTHSLGTKIQLWDCDEKPVYNKIFQTIQPEELR